MSNTWEAIAKGLHAPFGDEDVFWRIDRSYGQWARVLCYLDARAVMDRLDAVVGAGNWQDSYAETASGKNICTLSIRADDHWVRKSDGAGNTNIEGDKGGLSDAFKRAAVKWGIGRHLYSLGETKVNLSPDRPDCPKHYLVVCSKRGEKTTYGVAPSVQKLQAHLFNEGPPKEQTDTDRRLERLRDVIRKNKVPRDKIPIVLEALTAVSIQSADGLIGFEKPGLENVNPKELSEERLKIVSQRAAKWSESGLLEQIVSSYVQWKDSQ